MKSPVYYVAPGAVGRHPFKHSKRFVAGSDPIPVFRDYGYQGGEIFLELESGEYLAFKTGVGNILGVKQVEG